MAARCSCAMRSPCVTRRHRAINYDRDPGQIDVQIHATNLSECSYEVIKEKVCLWRAVKHAACNQRVRVNAPQRDTPRAASSVCFSVCLSAGVGVSVCVRARVFVCVWVLPAACNVRAP
jgi:hypothetical protein